MENRIPTIDISGLFSQSEEEINKISKLIGDACFNVGFFQIVGHGIDQHLIHSMINEVQIFFNQSDEQKHRYAVQKWNPLNKNNSYRGYFPSSVNGKEGLDFSSPYLDENHQLVREGIPFYQINLYPMNSILIQYWNEMWRISKQLMNCISRSLGMDQFFFDQLLDDRSQGGCGTVSTLRFNYYPFNQNQKAVSIDVDDGQELSCESHCDGSILTILYQHQVGGLQVQIKDKTWIDVPVLPHAFVINTGKCLQRWTNDHFKAINHRVILLKQQRISIPFFLEPSYSTIIKPIIINNEQPIYQPITYGEYITQNNKSFKEYQRD